MKAVGFHTPGDADQLHDLTLPTPEPGPRDVLVSVAAVSVNPIDTKLRQRVSSQPAPVILGFDACGIVSDVGSEVQRVKKGDRVWYAGAVNRPGSNAQYQCVDERLVAAMPQSLGLQEGAALPLTTLTAWEALETHMGLRAGDANNAKLSVLIIGGAGGVGSIAIQLAARYFGVTVIATAGNSRSERWCRAMGAHHVVDYREPLGPQLEALGLPQVDAVLLNQQPDAYWPSVCELIAPFGTVCALVDAAAPLDMNLLKAKSARLSWEFMFTRSLFNVDMEKQGEILAHTAALVDDGTLQTTVSEGMGTICADNLIRAHRAIETGATLGKLVLVGWE